MPPNIHFSHQNIHTNPALTPNGTFKVNTPTDITISLVNDGDVEDSARVFLYWSGPAAGALQGTHINIVGQLAAPYNVGESFSVGEIAGKTTKTVTISWTPPSTLFPQSLGASVRGCLFAQVTVDPIAPNYPGDTSGLNNWNPAAPHCAQHNIKIRTS